MTVLTPTPTPRAMREQRTFRALLDAMARPGSIREAPLHDHGDEYAVAISVMEALVDHEVSFAVLPERADLIDLILRQTGSHHVEPEAAGYVLCESASLTEALSRASDGDLEYPDRAATVICRVEGVSSSAGVGERLTLSGPGIKDTREVWVDGFDTEARAELRERNALPPLGIDLVLIAPDGQFVCLNRYTKLMEVT